MTRHATRPLLSSSTKPSSQATLRPCLSIWYAFLAWSSLNPFRAAVLRTLTALGRMFSWGTTLTISFRPGFSKTSWSVGVFWSYLPNLDFKLIKTTKDRTSEMTAIRYAVQKSNSRSRKVAGMEESDAMLVNLWRSAPGSKGIRDAVATSEAYLPVEGVVEKLDGARTIHHT